LLAATSAEEHENAIRFNYPMFSEVMTARTFAEGLKPAAMAAH
jgi:IMP dehydrogenase/GMP reductase